MICVRLMAAITDASRGSGGCSVSVRLAHHYSPSMCPSLERFCNRTLSISLHASAFILILLFSVVKPIICCAGALFQTQSRKQANHTGLSFLGFKQMYLKCRTVYMNAVCTQSHLHAKLQCGGVEGAPAVMGSSLIVLPSISKT